MKTLTIRQARQSLSHLDDVLEAEGEITITKRGKAVARVVQLGKGRPVPSHKDLRDKMTRMKKGSEKLVRDDRDAR
ncbi:MAG: type II toxin-antitoxin system Phd/YefM family antitoxin [Nitrospirae bacterium]|nr:type II toxin-antitoxin system Phd/YefM family antitoxin [Nitrospirota bacterium]